MKKFLFLFLVFVSFSLYAQQDTNNSTQEEANGFSMSGAVGSVTFDNVTYSEFHLTPEINFWKIGIGLDFDLLVDPEGLIRKEDWDDSKDIITKIYMIRFAQRGEPFYARVGGFPNYTLSHGLIMNHYSNMLLYPQIRQVGVMFGFNTPDSRIGAEIFSSNIVRNEILAGRAHIKPLTGLGILKNLDVGVSAATDRNQFGGLDDVIFDTDADGIPDKKDIDADNDGELDASPYVMNKYPVLQQIQAELDATFPHFENMLKSKRESVTEFGLDYELPLIQKKAFYLSHYGEASKIQDYNMGFIFPGFYSKFLIFEMNAEIRHFQDKFIPGYFDQLYDQQRAIAYYNENSSVVIDTILTKKGLIKYAKASTGWFASLTTSLVNMVFLTVSYQDMYSDNPNNGKSLWGNIRVNPKIVPKIHEADITYSQVNVDKIKHIRSNNALLEGKVVYSLSPNTNLVGRYTERYIDIDNDGKITHRSEILKTFGTSVEFRF
jgi:hypothetical protein